MEETQSGLSIDYLRETVRRKFSIPESKDKKNIGLELELYPFKKTESGDISTMDIINEKLRGSYDLLYSNSLCICSLFEQDKKLAIPRLNSKSGGIITFEPGGQIEYSSSAETVLSSVIEQLITNISELEQILKKDNAGFFFGGMNPWHSVETVGLKMNKPRYQAMDQYFKAIGPYGQQMMRLSASLQVNLDFGSPDVAALRWKASNLIAPIFCAMFGNTPFFNSKATGLKSYRTKIWQHLDPSRTGFPHLKSENREKFSCVDQYTEFALNAYVFMLPNQNRCLGYCENGIPFRDWLSKGYNGYFPTIEDWESHLTTLFPDVRPKGFLEIRFIDGQSKPCWAVPAILSTAIIYDEYASEKIVDLLMPYAEKLDQMSVDASIKGVEAFPDLCRKVFEIGLNPRDYPIDNALKVYCENFFKRYTAINRNPADDLLMLNNGEVFTLQQYDDYESVLFDIIQPPTFVATKDSKDLASECNC